MLSSKLQDFHPPYFKYLYKYIKVGMEHVFIPHTNIINNKNVLNEQIYIIGNYFNYENKLKSHKKYKLILLYSIKIYITNYSVYIISNIRTRRYSKKKNSKPVNRLSYTFSWSGTKYSYSESAMLFRPNFVSFATLLQSL